jgi:RNA polymerase sigma-70 factor (ECF subfamily)
MRALEGSLSDDVHVADEIPRIRRFLQRQLGPRDDLDDLTQIVLLELCRSLHRFRGDSSLSSFIGGITIRVARRVRRQAARRVPDCGCEEESLISDSPSPEQSTYAREQLRRVHAALAKLSTRKRTAFLLWALEGKAPEEIALLTAASLAATRSRIFYAQKELKRKAARDPYLRELIAA